MLLSFNILGHYRIHCKADFKMHSRLRWPSRCLTEEMKCEQASSQFMVTIPGLLFGLEV